MSITYHTDALEVQRDVDKLPKWAQEYIHHLENRIKILYTENQTLEQIKWAADHFADEYKELVK